MKGFLSDKKAVLAGAVSAVVLTVMRIIQLVSCTEYPSLLYANGCEAFNTVFNVLLIISAAVISILAYFDVKNAKVTAAGELSEKGSNIFGIIMIIAGAVWILPVINDFSYGSVGFTTITSLACCIAYLIGGMSMMASAKIVPAHCISAIFIIINYLIVANKILSFKPDNHGYAAEADDDAVLRPHRAFLDQCGKILMRRRKEADKNGSYRIGLFLLCKRSGIYHKLLCASCG